MDPRGPGGLVEPNTEDLGVSSEAPRELWVYGDNILECERALDILAVALAGDKPEIEWTPSPLFAPTYSVRTADVAASVRLFPGYGRWGYDVREHFRVLGAPLREAPDAVVVTPRGTETPEPLIAYEFSGALPAGNNAWQRMGRGLAAGLAGVPYLYLAEIGGAELGVGREPKSARFPNPVVPFAYLSMGQALDTIALPVFVPSPTASEDMVRAWRGVFDEGETLALSAAVVRGEDRADAVRRLQAKAVAAVASLAAGRRRADSLTPAEWAEVGRIREGRAKAEWFARRRLPWSKRASLEALTPSFAPLVAAAQASGAVAVGSSSIPICLLPEAGVAEFERRIRDIYGERIGPSLLDWLARLRKPIAIVWIAGFKPGGDDSRPDRGLLPMANMLFGPDDVGYLAVIYGPAPTAAWAQLEADPMALARDNGLWEAIIGLSDAIIVDSATAAALGSLGQVVTEHRPAAAQELRAPSEVPVFGEHDVDSVLHALFSRSALTFECLCNPPGGDWSALRYQPEPGGMEYRWSGLPRVTAVGSKRPDHVALLHGDPPILISAESKDRPTALESDIGPRLLAYVEGLAAFSPNGVRRPGDVGWAMYAGSALTLPTIVSAAAVVTGEPNVLRQIIARGHVDVALGCEFLADGVTKLHLVSTSVGAVVVERILKLAERFGGWLVVEVHALADGI